MNKSLLTNLCAAVLVGVGLMLDSPWREPVLATGMFALAGGITNWLAIHMLFEKVPGLYGSGVITARFAEFRTAIEKLVMEQFFNQQNLDRFVSEMLDDKRENQLDFSEIIDQTDLNPVFDNLVATIMESSFGSMLSMVGGAKALKPLKEPFIRKMQQSLNDIAHSEHFQQHLRDKLSSGPVSDDLYRQIYAIVHSRLDELTPQMVKQMIQDLIRQHLGWLVVWGGVFGGLIGLLTSFLPL
ncbi:DUF445 domain-containing protein [Methylophaga sp. SB9B]|uniref:DUF445 domain-containing protein n=1 Tax=Methylophaga sp. SB9B TaxID=2570356 RepID=UPI0010A8832E|nr:DUF445 domain-containing protein [Methylophaga sp. SB9B]THK40659.1 DUF445 domain-containing protein [Methylophaga sp. SB9B]